MVDEALQGCDLKAVEPLVKIVGLLDRYHGLAPARPAPETPSPPLALPAPPLALTHAAPPIDGESVNLELADAGQTADLADDPAQKSHEPV